jgi:serine/threonine protein phosphatase PrpC
MHPYLSRDCKLFGICDGHGTFGKEASLLISNSIPTLLNTKSLSTKSLEETLNNLDFLFKNCGFDASFSGSTLCFCIIQRNKLFTVNVGDSRAILGRKGFIRWEALQLTVDHKPDLPAEAARIRAAGGRLAQSGGTGPVRVWMPEKNSPGLAMSRSLGDCMVHAFGVVSLPDVFERNLGDEDEFVVVGSDGLFEFLSNQDVATIAGDHLGDAKAACDELVATARARWARVRFR